MVTGGYARVLAAGGQYEVDGQNYLTDRDRPRCNFESVSDNYFNTLGLKILDGRDFTIDDIENISKSTPLICDLTPTGRFNAVDMYRAGGVRLLTQRLIEAGYVDGSALTATGATTLWLVHRSLPGLYGWRSAAVPLGLAVGFATIRLALRGTGLAATAAALIAALLVIAVVAQRTRRPWVLEARKRARSSSI